MNSDLVIFAVGFAVTLTTFAGIVIAVVDKYHLTLDMLRERRRAKRRKSEDPATTPQTARPS